MCQLIVLEPRRKICSLKDNFFFFFFFSPCCCCSSSPSEAISSQTGGRTDGRTNGRTDERADGQADGQADRRADASQQHLHILDKWNAYKSRDDPPSLFCFTQVSKQPAYYIVDSRSLSLAISWKAVSL